MMSLKPLILGAIATVSLAEFNFDGVALITGLTTGFYTIAKGIEVLVDAWIKYKKSNEHEDH